MYKGKSMDAQNIKDKDIIKNEVKDLWNKHKLLLLFRVYLLLYLLYLTIVVIHLKLDLMMNNLISQIH